MMFARGLMVLYADIGQGLCGVSDPVIKELYVSELPAAAIRSESLL